MPIPSKVWALVVGDEVSYFLPPGSRPEDNPSEEGDWEEFTLVRKPQTGRKRRVRRAVVVTDPRKGLGGRGRIA